MMIPMTFIYAANIIVAGWVGIACLFFPKTAMRTVFTSNLAVNESVQITGALWLTVAILSVAGLWRPVWMSPLLLFQLIYKGMWLLVVALPALLNHHDFPKGIAVFFAIWVLLIPFAIPWKSIF